MRRGRALAGVLALGLALVGAPAAAATPTWSVGPAWSVDPVAPTAGCAATTLAGLTLPQQVGQLFMLGIGGVLESGEQDLIKSRHLGSVTFSAIVAGGRPTVHATANAVQALASRATTGGVRFLVAANQEGGYVQALQGTGFDTIPSALTQGSWSTSRLRTSAATWGRQLLRAGVNTDLAPVADVVPASWVSRNAPIGRLHREFGHAPDTVRSHVKAFQAGMIDAGVLTSVKHFPGLGRVVGNTDFTSGVRDTVTTRDDPFLTPFKKSIANGVPIVMVSLAEYTKIDPGTLAAFSKPIIAGMLRGDLGFSGVVASDSLSAAAVSSVSPGDRAIRFIRAGGDLVVVTGLSDARKMADAVLAKAQAKPTFAAKVAASALRILKVKDQAGLLPCS
ncbi:MAG: glycoside hydrolase family 3 N-terminal domain-containing protein [Chloroflexota bacterium]